MLGRIYKIVNKINNKCYIGCTTYTYLSQRWSSHMYDSRSPNRSNYNYPLYKDIRSYGKDNFEITELCKGYSKEGIKALEILCIIKYNTLISNGYNICLGVKHIGKTKQLLSEKLTDYFSTSENRLKQRESNRWQMKPIKAIHIETGIEYEFESLSEACLKLNLLIGNVSKCIKGERNKHRGYQFKLI